MILQTICCDLCGTELPKETIIVYGHEIEIYKTSRCEEWDLSSVLPHLCKPCALEIDNKLLKFKLDIKGETK